MSWAQRDAEEAEWQKEMAAKELEHLKAEIARLRSERKEMARAAWDAGYNQSCLEAQSLTMGTFEQYWSRHEAKRD